MKYYELAEKKSHGTPELPIEFYYVDEMHPRYVMQAHWHKEFEIIRVRSGKLDVYLNNVKHELLSGDCLFVEGGCLKYGYPENCVYECLVFDTSLLKRQRMTDIEHSLFDNPTASYSFKNFIDKKDECVHTVIDRLFDTMRYQGTLYSLEAVSLLYRLFVEFYNAGYIQKKSREAPDKALSAVIAMIEWIEDNLREPITLAELSRVSGLSEKYVCRIFKLYTAKTVIEYVNELRIEKACLEIITQSVTEAAFCCGFNDLSYFCKTFKRYKGMSPREYREQALSNKKNAVEE